MAWIESHQALGNHPKTQRLATLLKVSLPTAVGHLHYLWWWALDFAPTGRIPNATPTLIAHAAQWRGQPDRFWLAAIQSGFLDVNEEEVSFHDWLDYAGRLLAKRTANRDRQRRHRDADEKPGHAENGVTSRVTNALVTGLPTVPTGDGVKPSPLPTNPKPLVTDSPPALGSAGANGAPPRAADDAVPRIHAEAGVCPLCRLPFTGTYLEHTAAKHKVKPAASPGNLFGGRRGESAEAPPPEVAAQFAAMHERLQSLPDEAQA